MRPLKSAVNRRKQHFSCATKKKKKKGNPVRPKMRLYVHAYVGPFPVRKTRVYIACPPLPARTREPYGKHSARGLRIIICLHRRITMSCCAYRSAGRISGPTLAAAYLYSVRSASIVRRPRVLTPRRLLYLIGAP